MPSLRPLAELGPRAWELLAILLAGLAAVLYGGGAG